MQVEEISIKLSIKFRQCRAFSMLFWSITGWENTWKILQKYGLNSASKTFPIAFLTVIPSKYHPNSRKYYKNSIRVSVLSAKKWVVFHRNNSGKHAVNLDKIGAAVFRRYSSGIQSKFRCDSRCLPLECQRNSSGIPL